MSGTIRSGFEVVRAAFTGALLLSTVAITPSLGLANTIDTEADEAPVAQASAEIAEAAETTRVLPQARARETVPRTRWSARPEAAIWTRAMLSAMRGHAKPLVEVVPRDIAEWCPGYPDQGPEGRAAFWAGFASALAFHESTYRPEAVGGGGKWYGLLQILPATARGYGCRARSGEALKHGAENLSCALRILAVTVPRDQVIAAKDKRWRGVAADWGPMRKASKRADISGWTRKQSYCVKLGSLRPKSRPKSLGL